MPWQGSKFVQDGRSPLDRLYGYQETMAKMQAMKQQQDLMRERQKILAESLTPAQAAQTQYSAASNPLTAIFGGAQGFAGNSVTGYAPSASMDAQALVPEVKATQTEAKPAQFDAESAVARLYGAGDLEGAQSIINDQYKGAMGNRAGAGGAETWAVKGRLVRDQDGQIFEEVASNRGNVKLRPVGGELVGQNQVIRAGGKTYIKDAYSNETREVIDTTMTPDQIADNDPELQGRLSEARARGGAAGKVEGESEANADIGAEKGLPVVSKTLSIVDELRRHPGREWGTGGSSWTSAVPGTPAFDFGKKLEQLTGQAFLSEVEKMRGLGTLTETEGRKLVTAAAALDAAQSEPEFVRQLDIFRAELIGARDRHAKRLASSGRGNRVDAPQTAPKPSAMPSLPNPAQHKGRIVRDTSTGVRWQSNGAQWVRVK